MARKRMIDPEFWIDEDLAKCSFQARLLFIGLWNFADDKGRLRGDPKRIKGQVFPYDDIDVAPLLKELADATLGHCISPYEIEGRPYLWIPKFLIYQQINRPSPSKIPPHPNEADIMEHSVMPHEDLQEHSVMPHEDLQEHSVMPHEDLQDISRRTPAQEKRREEKLRESHPRKGRTSKVRTAHARAKDDEDDFFLDDSEGEGKTSYALCSAWHELTHRYPTASDRKTEEELRATPDWNPELAITAMNECYGKALTAGSRPRNLGYCKSAIQEALKAGGIPSKCPSDCKPYTDRITKKLYYVPLEMYESMIAQSDDGAREELLRPYLAAGGK